MKKNSNNTHANTVNQSSSIRRQFVKGIGVTAVWSTPLIQSVLLPAHAQTSTGPINDLTELSNWYETPADSPIIERRILSVVLNFTNASGGAIEFSATPSDTIQVWSTPSVGSPTIVFSVSPAGSMVSAGETFSYEFSVDFASVPMSDAGLAFRPVSNTLGTMSPSQASLNSVSIT